MVKSILKITITLYTSLFIMVANVPRCDAIISAVMSSIQEDEGMACHDEEIASVTTTGQWLPPKSYCACIVFDLFLAIPASLEARFSLSSDSYPMTDGVSKILSQFSTFIASLSPPPRY